MKNKRTILVRVIAVLYGLYGVYNLFFLLLDLEKVPVGPIYIFGLAYRSAVTAFALISMFGLWMLKPWGRVLAISFNVVTILLFLVTLVDLPSAPLGRLSDMRSSFMTVYGIAVILFGLITLFLLLTPLKPSVSNRSVEGTA